MLCIVLSAAANGQLKSLPINRLQSIMATSHCRVGDRLPFFEKRTQEWQKMKRFLILVVAICAIVWMASDAQAQRHGSGWHGGPHHHHHGYRRGGGGFAISIGSPYYGIGYSNLRPIYGEASTAAVFTRRLFRSRPFTPGAVVSTVPGVGATTAEEARS
jgi:hypothetical protein